MAPHTIESLKSLQPQHEFFLGIDSDGCVFDTMEIKQKECFIPKIVKMFDLQMISKYVRECAEFVNLYSKWRGANRYPALLQTLTFVSRRPEVKKRGVPLPDLTPLRKWCEEETKLGLPALKVKVETSGDPFLRRVMEWSIAVDESVESMVKGVGPFPGVRELLEMGQDKADMIVVSQTPTAALVREWDENKIDHLVRIIAGQELGTKTEHLQMAADGKYAKNHVLMIGDAPGDQKAAQAAGALFFPILPGHEDDSWDRLLNEGFDRFLNGQFAGEYQDGLVGEFEKMLPGVPPWE